MLKLSVLLFVSVLSVVNCQFYYNYEEDTPEEIPSRDQNPDPSAYAYNPPSAVTQQFTEPRRSDAEPQRQSRQGRTRIRVRSRSYQSDPGQPSNYASDDNQQAVRQERRIARRRERQRDYFEPTQSPRVYSPSIFERIELGEAPSGVYIPQNSFLNVLRNPSQREPISYPVAQPVAAAPQVTNYVQPYTSYEPQTTFFVQPPSNEEPRQTNLILPVSRPPIVYGAQANRLSSEDQGSISQNVPSRAVRTNRQSHQMINSQPGYSGQPTVDIDSFREYTDDVTRDDIQVMPRVEYTPVTVQRSSRPQNRRRIVTNYQVTSAPRVYSPSVFEKVSLGEAPSGVYVPEDSLLNTLRNPSASRTSRRESQPLQAQPSYAQDYMPEIIEEEEYQPPPPPPPPAPKRRTPQRSRQQQTSRRSERQRYQNENYDQTPVQPPQSSSQGRSQRRNENYDDYQRQTSTPQQVQRQTRPAATPTRSQVSTSENEQRPVRKAKLAIAALPEDTDGDEIPGEAGVDYPVFHVIPKTSFSCSQQPHNGYYADVETSCQVVHVCQARGAQNSFLCPNGTIWNQEKFSCQWWYKVNCNDAPNFYIKNDELYKVPEKNDKKRN